MPMNIALLGYGTVARGVHRILEERVPDIHVARVFCLPQEVDSELKTSDFQELLDTPGLSAVVEAMGGIEFPRQCILAALERGISVVTSNKAVVAAHFAELAAAAEKSGASLMIEATVGGGIPWIHNLERVARIDEVSSFSGILNGTTNFIISQMRRNGAEFGAVLAEAQRLGYAEADPSADIDGIDVWNKTIITASLAFGVDATHEIPAWGIRSVTKGDLEALDAKALTVKLMARGVREAGRYAACVTPVILRNSTMEANVPDNYNIASLTGETIGTLKFYGQGAGGDPTGNAVVQDLIELSQGYRPQYHLGSDIVWEPRLLTSDWLVRSSAPLRASDREVVPGYKAIRAVDPVEAHAIYQRLLADDPGTFMAAVPQDLI